MKDEDVTVGTWPPYGTGGQHAGSPLHAVVVFHHESRIGVAVAEERSQIKNKKRARELLDHLLDPTTIGTIRIRELVRIAVDTALGEVVRQVGDLPPTIGEARTMALAHTEAMLIAIDRSAVAPSPVTWDDLTVIRAEELLPAGATLPTGVCRTCGGCREMVWPDRYGPGRGPCQACKGTGREPVT